MTWEYRKRNGKHEMFLVAKVDGSGRPDELGIDGEIATVALNGLESIDVAIDVGGDAIIVSIPRDMFENVAERLRREENKELMAAGWNVYDSYGWWRQGECGAAETRKGALRRVRKDRENAK